MIDTKKEKLKGFIPKTISSGQAKDTGMAMVLICLLIGYFFHVQQFIVISILLLLINMIWPNIYKPAAKLWLGLSNLLGTVMSKILLSILYFVIVTPVGLLRRLLGKDSLQIKKWKKGRASVFRERSQKFKLEDIKNPF